MKNKPTLPPEETTQEYRRNIDAMFDEIRKTGKISIPMKLKASINKVIKAQKGFNPGPDWAIKIAREMLDIKP